MFPIKEVGDLDLAFPTGVQHLMPRMSDIPKEFHDGKTPWNKLVGQWFFLGLSKLELVPREGVDANKALRHIRAIMGSFEPKHEHKEAACAYLLSQWFEDNHVYVANEPQRR